MGRTFTQFLTLVVLCGAIGCSSRNTIKESPPTYGELAQFRNDKAVYQEAIDYNDALRALAKELNVPLVDVHAAYPAFAAKKKTFITDMLPDGMHPGDLGHELVAELLLPVIRSQLR